MHGAEMFVRGLFVVAARAEIAKIRSFIPPSRSSSAFVPKATRPDAELDTGLLCSPIVNAYMLDALEA